MLQLNEYFEANGAGCVVVQAGVIEYTLKRFPGRWEVIEVDADSEGGAVVAASEVLNRVVEVGGKYEVKRVGRVLNETIQD